MLFFSKFKISSRFPSAFRASPLLILARSLSASGSIFVFGETFLSAFLMIFEISSVFKGLSDRTRLLESSGVIISNPGFSVVAPIKFINPLSICGKKASCCDLLKR